MIKTTFRDLVWEKGEVELMQGVKGNRIPSNAISGGNGSFIVIREPAKVILELETKYDFYYIDIIREIRQVTGRKRMSKKLIKTLKEGLKDKEFMIDSFGDVINIRNILRSIVS